MQLSIYLFDAVTACYTRRPLSVTMCVQSNAMHAYQQQQTAAAKYYMSENKSIILQCPVSRLQSNKYKHPRCLTSNKQRSKHETMQYNRAIRPTERNPDKVGVIRLMSAVGSLYRDWAPARRQRSSDGWL